MSTSLERRPRQPPVLAVLVPMLALLVLVVAGVLLWRAFRPSGTGGAGLNPAADLRPVVARGELAPVEQMNIEIYERAAPSVVHVTNLTEVSNPFNFNVQQVPKGTGTGFVWDEDGHIVTNHHVVEGARAVKVTLNDHTSYDAKEVWSYRDKDIAVIWVQAPKEKLRPIALGTSHDVKVGQMTYAIGNPFGLDQTLTTGVVSALDREIEEDTGHPIQGAIQTSAAINPGNSGGPLLDSAGRLIGMNTAIVSPSGAFAGIGFAIPADDVNLIATQLIRHGRVVRPVLGVQVAEDQLARRLGVDKGALVLQVVPNSPAAKAGLRGTRRGAEGIQLGDVIVAVNGQEVNNGKELQNALGRFNPGDTVTLTIVRDGQRQDVKVQLQGSDREA